MSEDQFTQEVKATAASPPKPPLPAPEEINWEAMKGESPTAEQLAAREADPSINPQRFDLQPPEQMGNLARAFGQLADAELQQDAAWHTNEAFKYMNAHMGGAVDNPRHQLPNLVLAARELLLADFAVRNGGKAPAVI